jgi:hypothetical protein
MEGGLTGDQIGGPIEDRIEEIKDQIETRDRLALRS